jgi:hypothetical protein
MTQFTPGPWSIEDETHDTFMCIKGEHEYVCTMDQQKGPEQTANARLIAAAPSLYEALVLLVAHTEDALVDHANKEVFAAARRALSMVSDDCTAPQGMPQGK